MMRTISYSMNRKWLLIIILSFTLVGIGVILFLSLNHRYNHYVENEKKWQEIQSTRKESTSISLEKLEWNDSRLILDEKLNTFYYSLGDYSKKYNPTVSYTGTAKVKLMINKKITQDEETGIEVMIYNKEYYRTYSVSLLNKPILNIIYQEEKERNLRVPVMIELTDNRKDAFQKMLLSDGIFSKIGEELHISLRRESLGQHERNNEISLFGMPKEDNYILTKKKIGKDSPSVEIFINNEYQGNYFIGNKEERRQEK